MKTLNSQELKQLKLAETSATQERMLDSNKQAAYKLLLRISAQQIFQQGQAVVTVSSKKEIHCE